MFLRVSAIVVDASIVGGLTLVLGKIYGQYPDVSYRQQFRRESMQGKFNQNVQSASNLTLLDVVEAHEGVSGMER